MFGRRNGCSASLGEAIAYLASACDGAIRRDGHGFNADHVALGHRLAQKHRWTWRDRRRAHGIAVQYRRQLIWAGLAVKGITEGATQIGRQPAQWACDPTGVHQLRYWNGSRWTAGVRR